MGNFSKWLLVTIICSTIAPGSATNMVSQAQAQTSSRLFQETGHTLKGRFLQYWEQNGGLPQQGFPISEEMQERSDTDGKTYVVQYMERAVFELHPENRPPYDVLLSLVGVFEYGAKYPKGAPNQRPNKDPGTVLFPETGKSLGGGFLKYWRSHGGLTQQGYPISDEFTEVSKLDGKTYTVQYFQRAVFEYHPEHIGTEHEVLLSQLGTFRFKEKFIYPKPAIPGQKERIRMGLAASDRYLVWGEATANNGIAWDTGDIFGYDLSTGTPLEITKDVPNDQSVPAISGSIVTWQNQVDANISGRDNIVGKDLASGKEYVISSADVSTSRYPAIAGKTVVWMEFDAVVARLLMKDLDGASITELVRLSGDGRPSLLDPQVSDEFVVWTELRYNSRAEPQSKPTFIKAYNRRTGETRNVHEYTANASGGNRIEYSLDGHRVALATEGFNESPRVLNLLTGQTLSVEWGGLRGQGRMYLPTLKGDILVWVISGGGNEGWDIWGVNLQGGKPVPLVIGPGNQVGPVIAGDMLAWHDDGATIVTQTATGIMPLSSAFATAPDRLRELERILPPLPTPPPTSALPSPTRPPAPLHTPTP